MSDEDGHAAGALISCPRRYSSRSGIVGRDRRIAAGSAIDGLDTGDAPRSAVVSPGINAFLFGKNTGIASRLNPGEVRDLGDVKVRKQ